MDVNKPNVQSSQQYQHIVSSPEHDNSPTSNQPSAASLPPNVAAQQEGSGPSNATVSQPSNVTIDSTRSESQQKSSSVAAGTYLHIHMFLRINTLLNQRILESFS